MKSVFISFLMFCIVLAAIHFKVFRAIDSWQAWVFAFICLIGSLVFAFIKIGASEPKDNDHE